MSMHILPNALLPSLPASRYHRYGADGGRGYIRHRLDSRLHEVAHHVLRRRRRIGVMERSRPVLLPAVRRVDEELLPALSSVTSIGLKENDPSAVFVAVPMTESFESRRSNVNYLVPEGPGLAKGLVASSVVRSLCLAHLVLTSHHEGMLLDCAIACVPKYMGLRTQHRVTDKTRFLLQPRYTQSEYANKNQLTYNNQPDLRTPKRGFESPDKNNVPKK